jgi:hypothetical protein
MKKGHRHKALLYFSFLIFNSSFLLQVLPKKNPAAAGSYKQLVWSYAILKLSRNLVLKFPLMNCSFRISC